MLNKIRDTIHSVLRIHKGEGNQFFTHDGKQKLIETKTFFRKYTRLLTGLFVAIVCVALALLLLVRVLMIDIIMPLIESKVLPVNILNIELSEGYTLQLGQFIGYLLMFVVVYIIALIVVRRLGGGVEIPQEERIKRCPMCGEQILDLAIKCKHCGSTVGRERIQSHQPPTRSYSGPVGDRDRGTPSRQRSDRYQPAPSRRNHGSSQQDTRKDTVPSSRSSSRQSQGPSSRSSGPSQGPSSRSSSGPSQGPSSRGRSTSYRSKSKEGRYRSKYDRPKTDRRGDQSQNQR